MSALPDTPQTMSEAEYLDFERDSAFKHEFIDGAVVAMSGASVNHNRISINIGRVLSNQLLDSKCEVFSGDMRVKVIGSGLYAYPDLTVLCGEPQFAEGIFDTLTNPIAIIEILSPSTEGFDRGEKFRLYRQLPSLQAYLLIEQGKPHIEQYVRRDDTTWLLTDYEGLDSTLTLPSINCRLLLSDVYRRVTFETDADESL